MLSASESDFWLKRKPVVLRWSPASMELPPGMLLRKRLWMRGLIPAGGLLAVTGSAKRLTCRVAPPLST
jgi:hypothetical protein